MKALKSLQNMEFLLKLFDVVPSFSENLVMNIAGQVLTFLGLIGVIVDPTTAGIEDSNRAMTYEEPWKDEPDGKDDAQ